MNSRKSLKIAFTTIFSAGILVTNAAALYPATVNADALYLRSEPGGSVINVLPQNTTIAVISNSDEWYQVAVGGQTGYVSGEYVKGTTNVDFKVGTGYITCDTTVNLRESASTSANVLTSLPNDASVSLVGVYDGWYKVTYGSQTGFVHPDYVTFEKPDTVVTASATLSASSEGEAVVAYAEQFLGVPYVYGGNTPSGFDCSGFTSYVYANTYQSIPRVAQSQYDAIASVSRDELLPGDLVFFGSSSASISHVGIYVGEDTFIHAPHTGDVVKYDTLTGSSYEKRFQGGGRVIS